MILPLSFTLKILNKFGFPFYFILSKLFIPN